MKNKVFILFATVLAILLICLCSCGENESSNTSATTSGEVTTQATTVDMTWFDNPDIPKRTVHFGGKDTEIFLSNQITLSGAGHDLFIDRELNVYDFFTGTNTFYLISLESFSAAKSDADAGILASSFLSSQINFFSKYQWAVSTFDDCYNVEFTISDDAELAFLKDPEYAKIIAKIPRGSSGPAEFWFTK